MSVPPATPPTLLTPPRHPRIGLALGGGGARGLSHLLMLEAFDELGIKPVAITGTSIGALLGGAYAAGLSAAYIRAEAETLLGKRTEMMRRLFFGRKDAFGDVWSLRSPALLNGEAFFEAVLPGALHINIEDMPIPFTAVATDFYAQHEVDIRSGPLIAAIAASCALPAVLKPVRIGDRVLIDGGFSNPVPYEMLAKDTETTVAIDVTGNAAGEDEGMPSTLETLYGAMQIVFLTIMRQKLRASAPDILIRPDVGRFRVLELFKMKEILEVSQSAKDALKRQLEACIKQAALSPAD